MTQAISIITSEHARVRRILMLISELRKQLKNSDQAPDTVLFSNIFDYLDAYEKMHYPKEEKYLFKALHARDPESHAILNELQNEHREGATLMARLRSLLEACAEGSAEARKAFLKSLGETVHMVETHMQKEEQTVIPLALERLRRQDWRVVNEGYLHYDYLLDPLLGETVKAEFDQLHSRIIYYAPEPIGLGLRHPDTAETAAAETEMLGMEGGLDTQYGHVRVLDKLTKEDWQTINEQYLHYDDPHFGETVKDELRQLHSRIAYYAPSPIGLGMERTYAAPVPETVDQLLGISELTTHYGRIQALNGINVEINKGELVALVGSNGAGKTTLLRTISGLQPATSGTVRFAGQNITRLRADRRVKLGIVLIPEGRQVFGPMSVEDNLLLGAYTRPKDGQTAADLEQVYRLFPILKQKRRQAAGTLSGGQQQMLAMARALMARPQLLLLR